MPFGSSQKGKFGNNLHEVVHLALLLHLLRSWVIVNSMSVVFQLFPSSPKQSSPSFFLVKILCPLSSALPMKYPYMASSLSFGSQLQLGFQLTSNNYVCGYFHLLQQAPFDLSTFVIQLIFSFLLLRSFFSQLHSPFGWVLDHLEWLNVSLDSWKNFRIKIMPFLIFVQKNPNSIHSLSKVILIDVFNWMLLFSWKCFNLQIYVGMIQGCSLMFVITITYTLNLV